MSDVDKRERERISNCSNLQELADKAQADREIRDGAEMEGLRRMLLLQEQQLAIQQFRQHSRIHKEEPGLLPFRLRHN